MPAVLRSGCTAGLVPASDVKELYETYACPTTGNCGYFRVGLAMGKAGRMRFATGRAGASRALGVAGRGSFGMTLFCCGPESAR